MSKKVEFFVGSTLIGTDSIAPYSVSWTPAQIGIVGVLAKSIDNDGKFRFTDANVVEVVNASGVEEDNNIPVVSIFPLPAHEYMNVHVSGIKDPNGILQLMDITGNLIQERTLDTEMRLNTQGLNPGLYLISFRFKNGTRLVRKVAIEN